MAARLPSVSSVSPRIGTFARPSPSATRTRKHPPAPRSLMPANLYPRSSTGTAIDRPRRLGAKVDPRLNKRAALGRLFCSVDCLPWFHLQHFAVVASPGQLLAEHRGGAHQDRERAVVAR